jgi:hypothetical protein
VEALDDWDCASACAKAAPLIFAIAETDMFNSLVDSDVPHPGLITRDDAR